MADSNELHNIKLDFLEERELSLKGKVSAGERKLLEIIVDKIIDDLEVSDGKVLNSDKNIKLTGLIEGVFSDFNKTINSGILKQYIGDIDRTKALNEKYFEIFSDDKKKFKALSESTKTIVDRRIGIDKKGSPIKGGFLDSFVKDNRIQVELQNLLTKGITGGATFKEMKEDVKLFIVGDDVRSGSLESMYSGLIYDTYQQIDRLESGIYAESLKMEAFIYSGGKIKNTRDFCCQRNGLIFTVEEAEKWRTLRFQGKSKNYNPLIDLGGYGCRHSTQYISNVIAAKRRNDLELDEEGKLKYKDGVSKQRLHNC